MRILVTGGAGYIGSHTVLALLGAGHEVVVVDNLANSQRLALARVEALAGKAVTFHEIDLLDRPALAQLFAAERFEAVIHLAGLKAVGESWEVPLRYYHRNLTSTFHLCELMEAAGCRNLIFSSSATVYGAAATVPIAESAPLGATNPYGRSKLMLEQILGDLHAADPRWNITLLRYFNPVGAHESGTIGEDPHGRPNNLVPAMAQVATGKLPELLVFGTDYPTRDGTGVRDFIHVVDLAEGHLRAVEKLRSPGGLNVYNLGSGTGWTVLEMIGAFGVAIGRPVPVKMVGRRPGDIAVCYADPSKAGVELGWKATRGIEQMCADAWRWQKQNPDGYRA